MGEWVPRDPGPRVDVGVSHTLRASKEARPGGGENLFGATVAALDPLIGGC